MSVEAFGRAERHRGGPQLAQLVRPAFEYRSPLHEVEHREAAREPRRARRRQDVIRTADIVADRLRCVGAEKDSAGIADFCRERLRIPRHDFQMFRGERVRQRNRLI